MRAFTRTRSEPPQIWAAQGTAIRAFVRAPRRSAVAWLAVAPGTFSDLGENHEDGLCRVCTVYLRVSSDLRVLRLEAIESIHLANGPAAAGELGRHLGNGLAGDG